MESASRWGLDRLARLAAPGDPDMRPTLLRVLTELYVQKPTHTADEEHHYTELALRLLDAADIKTGMLAQNCSSPARQAGHVLSESTMQPTAARSPSLNLLTALPVFTTRPTISWPGTHGYAVGMMADNSLRTKCTSV